MTAVLVPKNSPTNYLAFSKANFSGGSRTVVNPDGTSVTMTWTASDAANFAAQMCYCVNQDCNIAKYDPLRGNPWLRFDLRLS